MDNKKVRKKYKEYVCDDCKYITMRKSHWERHILTRKHLMITNDNIKSTKVYNCECGITYTNRHNLSRHKNSKKCIKNKEHFSKDDNMANKWQIMANNGKLLKNVHFSKNENSGCKKMHICECGKSYKHKCSLSKHKKNCDFHKSQKGLTLYKDSNDPNWKTMFMELMEQNKEIIAQNTELAQKPTTINNNTQFNVMNYLNTECKDAMNLSDFIEAFEFSLKDLEELSTKGYQDAMKNTFIKQLCDMEKTKRPIHCSDKKRKSFYVKDNDVWEKDKDNVKLIRSMKDLSHIHNDTLNQWRNKHSDWNSNEKKQIFYCNSILEFAKCDKEKERNKILSKLVNLSIK